MSDRYGLLTLPMAGPFPDPKTAAVGDPSLDVLGAYLRAAINHDTKAAWAVIHPAVIPPCTEPLPVTFFKTHNPHESEFRENYLPALFVWRLDFPETQRFTQDWDKEVSRLAALWVPPPTRDEFDALRQPFVNAVAKSIHRSIRRGRSVAWKVPGDQDPKAEDYGSLLIKHLSASIINVLDVKPYPLVIEKSGDPYDSLLATIQLTELAEPQGDDYPLIDHVEGNITLGSPPLTVASYAFKPTILSIDPATGSTAGGTIIGIDGRQFFENAKVGPLRVLIGTTACPSVQFIDETTLVAITPPGAAGARDVTVVLPSGATATLPSAFTYA